MTGRFTRASRLARGSHDEHPHDEDEISEVAASYVDSFSLSSNISYLQTPEILVSMKWRLRRFPIPTRISRLSLSIAVGALGHLLTAC